MTHACQIAKLELRIIVAYFLAGFQFELVDREGAPLIQIPEPNYDTLTVVRGSSHLRICSHTPCRYVLCEKLS
jgi:hypothetical protein